MCPKAFSRRPISDCNKISQYLAYFFFAFFRRGILSRQSRRFCGIDRARARASCREACVTAEMILFSKADGISRLGEASWPGIDEQMHAKCTSMTNGWDSDHHMEWSVNLTRHEIANLSRRSQHLYAAATRKNDRGKKRETKKRRETRERSENGATARNGHEVLKKGRKKRGEGTHARFPAQYGQKDSSLWSSYLLYRNKEIRPSNKRVLRSQFNGGLPETVQRRLREASGRTSCHEI